MSTLTFQPEADRYYAQGYWRAGDLWQDFAAARTTSRTRRRFHDRRRPLTFGSSSRAAIGPVARAWRAAASSRATS